MKHILTQISRLLSLTVLMLSLGAPLAVSASASSVLTASSSTATKGSSVAITISLDTSGNSVFAYQADLSYSTSFFNSASIAISSGSPFQVDTGSNDPDVSSGGNIHFTRFSTTAKNYSGPIAVITLQSNGTAGSTSIDFKPVCPNVSTTYNCSAVADASNAQLLTSVSGGTIKLNEPVAAGTSGSASASSKGAKSKIAKASTTPSATSIAGGTATTATKNPISIDQGDTGMSHKVVLQIVGQDGKPVPNAKVTLNGVSGITNADGKVTLSGLSPGTAHGTVSYSKQVIPISLPVNSSGTSQTSKVSIKLSTSSAAWPVSIAVAVLAIGGIAAYLLISKKGKGLKANKNNYFIPKTDSVITAPQRIDPPKPKAPEPVKIDPAPKPAEPRPAQNIKDSSEEESLLHEKAMDPGTIVTPTSG